MHLFLSIFVKLTVFKIFILVLSTSSAVPLDRYLKLREKAIRDEESTYFGGNLVLGPDEILANKCLMSAKSKEMDEGYQNSAKYLPSHNFMSVRQEIVNSEVFKIIRAMPKGAVLHTHALSSCSLDFIFQNITSLPNLYVCLANLTVRFRFFETPNKDCDWKAMKELQASDPEIFIKIRRDISLPDPRSVPTYNTNIVWDKFRRLFTIINGLITYRPAIEMYLNCALQELLDDNVMYAEFRGPFYLDAIYELNGTVLDPITSHRLFESIVDKFTKTHPGFYGVKLIYGLFRHLNTTTFEKQIKIFRDIKRTFPSWILGFDISGYENGGHPDVYFAEELLKLSNETSFYFHAGETNWYGHPADENLFDAVLLNSKRIGHGLALLKHPALMTMVKEKNIAIEVNPISNQVLGYVSDLRNHPAAYYFANNFSVIISNDDPSFLGSSGLSYDFYEAFMGIMSRKSDLRALKQLAINSITYSGLNNDEKLKVFQAWEKSWFKFIKFLAYKYHCD